MKLENINLNHIDDRPDLFLWLIERLEESGPFLAITEEANEHCDLFIRALAEYEPITFVPLTTNTVARMKSTWIAPRTHTIPRTVQRSVALLEFLGTVGSIIDEFSDAERLSRCDVVAYALAAWTDGDEYLVVQVINDASPCRVVSSARGTLKFNVLIDVFFEPELYNPYTDRKFWKLIDDDGMTEVGVN